MKKYFLIFVVVHSLVSWSQTNPETPQFQFGIWTTEDKSAVVFADAVNVRKTADVSGELEGKITIGTKVQILEITKTEYTSNGVVSPWIKIKSGTITGYVWGGGLTKGSLKLKDGNTVVWGLVESKNVSEDPTYPILESKASVRVAEKGVVKSKLDFKVEHASRPDEGYLILHKTPLLDGVENLLTFETPSEACGVTASTHYLLYGKGVLSFVGSGYSMGDGGILSVSKEYIFPYPLNEIENASYHYNPDEGHIFCVENNGEYDEECAWTELTKVYDFTWTNGVLVRFCNE